MNPTLNIGLWLEGMQRCRRVGAATLLSFHVSQKGNFQSFLYSLPTVIRCNIKKLSTVLTVTRTQHGKQREPRVTPFPTFPWIFLDIACWVTDLKAWLLQKCHKEEMKILINKNSLPWVGNEPRSIALQWLSCAPAPRRA